MSSEELLMERGARTVTLPDGKYQGGRLPLNHLVASYDGGGRLKLTRASGCCTPASWPSRSVSSHHAFPRSLWLKGLVSLVVSRVVAAGSVMATGEGEGSAGAVDGSEVVPGGKKRRKGAAREFDWSKAEFGHFVLKIAYVGTNYHGLAWQELETCRTVEAELFAALVKTCLIKDRQSCQYSRCGRTDKGVHAAGNYIALQLRLRPSKASASDVEDYDYASMLNGVLPPDIRVLAAARAPVGFDARFSCKYRAYQYYFPLAGEDFSRMREAANHFVGEHDFRNFCKMDVENVTNFRREVLSVSVQPRGQVGEFAVTGVAFLWHQVRCMVAIVLLVGQGLEEPGLVAELLDIDKHPRKPLYDQADESGLVLRDCGFEDIPFAPGKPAPAAGSLDGFPQEADPPASAPATGLLASGAESLCRMRAQARRLAAVHECLAAVAEQAAAFAPKAAVAACASRQKRPHTPLLQRAACPTLEEKQAALLTKQRRKGEDAPQREGEPAEE